MFSRVFYDAKDLCEFPVHMKECLLMDHRGRFYEDFYHVVVQNEKFDDWFPTLTLLRQTFTDYAKLVVNYHNRPGIRIPTATNSTAAEGNFLEDRSAGHRDHSWGGYIRGGQGPQHDH